MTNSLTYRFTSKTRIREILNLRDSGNILLDGEEQYEKLKWMLVRRILDSQARQGEVHFRFRTRRLLENDLETLEKIAASGMKVVIWGTRPEVAAIRSQFDTVVLDANLPITEESFVVAAFGGNARTLVAWQSQVSGENSIKTLGVFATDPEVTNALITRIHSLLEA